MHFARANLEPALILAGRNNAKDARYARGIRFVLGSYTNHNALIIPDSVAGGFCVGDTTAPRSSIVPLEAYERLMNEEGYVVRIWRVRGLTDQERASVAYMWRTRCNNLPYADHTVRRLAIFRIVNHLPFRLRIHGTWCSENTARPFSLILPLDRDPARKPNGKRKNNVTPRTFENRLVQGILEDVTEEMIHDHC